jgi:hypothetical protein
MQAVVDSGFLEWGFHSSFARSVRKILEAMPTFVKTTPISIVPERIYRLFSS